MNKMRKSAKREKLFKKNQKEILELKDSEKEMETAESTNSRTDHKEEGSVS